MLDEVGVRLHAAVRRLERFERRELRDLHRWLEDTSHLLLLSVLVFVPLLMGLLTYLSNRLDVLPFLLFPPLASGTYTLFARPSSQAASPRRFVGGLTIGAASGWLALELTARYWAPTPVEALGVPPWAAGFGLLLTGVVTWGLDLEEAQAYSTTLLVLVTGADQLIYVVSVFASSVMVAGTFVVWHREIYSRRATLLYGTVRTDDHILVPLRGDAEIDDRVVAFAGQLAAAHDAGKVVLLDVVAADDATARSSPTDPEGEHMAPAVRTAASHLEGLVDRLDREFDVPGETAVVAARDDEAAAVLQAVTETSCDLIAVPFETDQEGDRVAPFLRRLLKSDYDVVALRPGESHDWRRILVPVRRDGEVAHAMVDFAQRLAGDEGSVTLCHCISRERHRRAAESMLADIVDQFDRAHETRVSGLPIETFLAENADQYDLTFVGASTDRSAASRVVSPPTFREIQALDCAVAVVHRG